MNSLLNSTTLCIRGRYRLHIQVARPPEFNELAKRQPVRRTVFKDNALRDRSLHRRYSLV
jgi:hypothetical protein